MSSKIKNTSDLRAMLLDTIEGVRDGSLEPLQARAISSLSCQILQSAKLDLDVAKLVTRGDIAQPQAVSLVSAATGRRGLAAA